MTERVITLEDLWDVFVRHLIPIILAGLLCMGMLLSYSKFILVPEYKSTATLYVLKQNNSPDYVYTSADFNIALNVVNDCTYMLKSHTVLDDVIKQLDLDMSYAELYGAISTANPENSRVLEVSVRTKSPQKSKRIADCVCTIAAKKITQAMGFDQVNVYSEGTLPSSPSNTIGLRKYAITGVAAAVAVYAAYLVAFMLDDRIKTEEDVTRYLGLNVLGEIPNSNNSGKGGRYGKYNRYSRYGRYGRYSRYGRYGKHGKYYQSYTAKGDNAK